MSAGTAFRLIEVGGGGGGQLTQTAIYGSVDEALIMAERILDRLADRPHRRPFEMRIQDVWTRQTVARVHADIVRDPDVCVACGQPNDPFAPPGDAAASGGADAGVPSPPADAPPAP